MIEDEFVTGFLHRTEVARIMKHAKAQSAILLRNASLCEKHSPKTVRNAKHVADCREKGSLLGGTADQCKLALDAPSPTAETEP